MELDTTLLQQDIYKIPKDKILEILQRYNVTCSDKDTVAELRPILVTIKTLLKDSQTEYQIKLALLRLTQNLLPLPQELKQRYPELRNLEDTIILRQHKYDPVASDLDSEEENLNQYHKYEPVNLQPQIPHPPPQYLNMATTEEKLPLISAGTFSGLITENPNDFIDKFNIAAVSNKWKAQTKLDLFPAYLAATALSWYKHYTSTIRQEQLNWDTLKTEFITAFTPPAQSQNLQAVMEQKIQKGEEPTLNYFLDVLTTCKRYDPQITDTQIINYTIQGLKPEICERVLTMKNDTLIKLQENLKGAELYVMSQKRNKEKYERVQSEYYNDKTTPPGLINTLQTEIRTLTNIVANLTLEKQDNYRGRNTSPYRNRQYTRQEPHGKSSLNHYDTHRKLVTFQNNGNRSLSKSPQQYRKDYNPNKYCAICKKTNHSQDACWFKTRKTQDPTQTTRPYDQYRNTKPQALFCSYCKRTNHNIQNCYRSKYYKGNRTQKNED